MKKHLAVLSFIVSFNTQAFKLSQFRNSSFNAFIIGSGLNYTRTSSGEDSLNPSLSWMTNYELNKNLDLKSNMEVGFLRSPDKKASFSSSALDFLLGMKIATELSISLRSGIHIDSDSKSISYGVEFEHQSKLLKKMKIRSIYIGIENIPNLEVPKKRVFSGARFNL